MDPTEKLFRKAQNIYRAHELVDSLVAGVPKGSRFAFSEDMIKRLHGVAMQGLIENPGQYRQGPVRITNSPHVCPSWIDVPVHMTMLCKYVEENWDTHNLIHLSAFVMWRMCWTHPFVNGNGRTARAASYMILCAKNGALFPPTDTIIEQIQRDKQPYYTALRVADDIYASTSNIPQALAPLEDLVSQLLRKQLIAGLAA